MSKPVFVFLHGAWHTPKCWEPLIAALDKAGYSGNSVAPALPSTNATPLPSDWSGDLEIIRSTVSDLVREHDVIVVVHSFSGMTAGTALEGLDKQACAAKGLKGGVVRLVYIAAFLVPEGFQHSPHGTRDNMIPEMKTDFETGQVTVLPEDAKEMFYQDLDDAKVAKLIKDLRPHSLGTYWCITTYAAWRYIPTTYIICTKDRPTTVAAEHYLIETAKASGTHKIDNIIEIDAGHSPFFSKTQWMAEILMREASR
ncbi:alpha/beta-hydrolase [Hypoxylon crocopeplum]|nr:alpha/beta-hydrolase [Hypoxylon crocopeplum]